MDTNVDIAQYTIPGDIEIKVSPFFRKVTALFWTSEAYARYYKALSPHAKHNSLLHNFRNDLQKIKDCDAIPSNIKYLIDVDKKGKARASSSRNIFIDSSTATFGTATFSTDHTINNFGASASAAPISPVSSVSPVSPAAGSHAADEYEVRADGPAPTSSVKRSHSQTIIPEDKLSCLYPHMYQLYKKQAVDLPRLEIIRPDSLLSLLKNGCIINMRKFNNLDREQRSYLHVLLSGCINTINADYQINLINIIGQEKLASILASSQPRQVTNYGNEVWVRLKAEIIKKYEEGGKRGLRCYIIEQRLQIHKSDVDKNKDLTLKVLDAFEFILNMIDFKDWDSCDLSEENYGFYWKSIIGILFRGTKVDLKRGESSCLASKFERQIHEYEYGDTNAYIMGRRMDLLAVIKLSDDKKKETLVELGSVEIKPEGVGDDVEVVQLNKNVRVNKSILYTLLLHMGMEKDLSDIYTIGVDIIGLHGYLYRVIQYEDVVAVTKIGEKDIFLPADDDDLSEFLQGDTMDQLLLYVEHNVKLYNKVKKGSKKYKRARDSAKTTNTVNPILLSPPRRNPRFPASTFFTPKRTNGTRHDTDLHLSEE